MNITYVIINDINCLSRDSEISHSVWAREGAIPVRWNIDLES